MTHSAHTQAQPGLMAHSWNPDDDLLKRFLFMVEVESGKGWLALDSYDDWTEAWARYIDLRNDSDFRRVKIVDQFESTPDNEWHIIFGS